MAVSLAAQQHQVFAHAAFSSLRARAAQNRNGRVGLSCHLRRVPHERLFLENRHWQGRGLTYDSKLAYRTGVRSLSVRNCHIHVS